MRTYMTVEVHIVTGEAKRVKIIPALALMRRPDGRMIVRVVNTSGAVEEREVKTGLNDRTNVEIKSGLNEGERVVTGELTQTQSSQQAFPAGSPPPGS